MNFLGYFLKWLNFLPFLYKINKVAGGLNMMCSDVVIYAEHVCNALNPTLLRIGNIGKYREKNMRSYTPPIQLYNSE